VGERDQSRVLPPGPSGARRPGQRWLEPAAWAAHPHWHQPATFAPPTWRLHQHETPMRRSSRNARLPGSSTATPGVPYLLTAGRYAGSHRRHDTVGIVRCDNADPDDVHARNPWQRICAGSAAAGAASWAMGAARLVVELLLLLASKGSVGVSQNRASTGSSLRGRAGFSDRSLTALGGRRRRQSRKWRLRESRGPPRRERPPSCQRGYASGRSRGPCVRKQQPRRLIHPPARLLLCGARSRAAGPRAAGEIVPVGATRSGCNPGKRLLHVVTACGAC
jgi:hypothetical protein